MSAHNHNHNHANHDHSGHKHGGHDHGGHSHDDHAGHNHGGPGHAGHSHAPKDFGRAFAVGITLNTVFVIVEAAYGLISNSLALVADAGHNLGDVLGLLLAWAAAYLVKRKPTERHTYGMKRTSIFAALINAALLLIAVGVIGWEAIERLKNPQPVAEMTVIWVALVGIAINTGTALMFMAGRKGDINIRGAYLHMMADAAVSVGVVVAALAMMLTGWSWIDPVVSLIIAGVITVGTWSLLKDSVNMALDAVPGSVDRSAISEYLAKLPGVTEVHDLHIWAMSTTDVALTAHLVRPGTGPDDALLSEVTEVFREKFGIGHVTLQVENGDPTYPCHLAPADVV